MGLKAPFFTLIFILSSLFGFQTLAQTATVDDGFEPFADYSEFVEASTEETDVNFFRYGRLLSVGLSLGQRTLTGDQREYIDDSLEFGAFISFYMTINFAFNLGYKQSTHDVGFSAPTEGINFDGRTRFQNIYLYAKYNINTQNLTKSIAKFNPYVIGGASLFIRETRSTATAIFVGQDEAASFDFGFGAEKLFNHNKNFVGLQFLYHHTLFADENDPIIVNDNVNGPLDTGLTPGGDLWSINVTFGFNF